MKLSEMYPIIAQYIPNEYIRALLILIIVTFFVRLVLRIFLAGAHQITKRTSSDLDDIILHKISVPLTIVASIISIIFASSELSLAQTAQSVVDNIVISLIAIVVAYAVYITIRIVMSRVWKKIFNSASGFDDTLLNLTNNIVTVVLFVISFVVILSVWGVDVGAFLAGLGIAGLAVALALQPTLANIFSGISLAAGKTVRVGDMIQLESGQMGTIHRIGLRTTRLKTFSNELFIIPNTKLADSIIQNFYLPNKEIRADVLFGVEYGADPEYVKLIAIEEVKKIKFIDTKKDINILFLEMADNSLNFKIMFWVDNIDKKWPAHQEAITRIYRRLYKEGIGIPFPQRTVWLNNEKSKPKNPSDKQFSKVKDKYYAQFGRKYSGK